MHSEVFVRFSDDVRFDRLTGGLPEGADPALVLSQTYYSNSLDALPSVIYARTEFAFVYMVFKDDERSLRVHVEGRASKGELKVLVKKSKLLAERFISTGRSHGYRLDCALISLYSGDYLITVGTHARFGERLLKRFAESIFGDVVVGVLLGLLTGILTKQWDAALIVGLASVSCFLAWLMIEIRGGRDEYTFEGF
jgi:hypothetical protein